MKNLYYSNQSWSSFYLQNIFKGLLLTPQDTYKDINVVKGKCKYICEG